MRSFLNIRSSHFPYVIQKVRPPSFWIILNREYKPLGFPPGGYRRGGNGWIDYNVHPSVVCVPGLTKRVQMLLSIDGIVADSEGRVWLYDDGSVPTYSAKTMDDYLERLNRLMNLKIRDDR